MSSARGSYRIRWANVSYGNGHRWSRERMCIAERKTWLGWWPCTGADWRWNEADAERDIEKDKALRTPLPVARAIP